MYCGQHIHIMETGVPLWRSVLFAALPTRLTTLTVHVSADTLLVVGFDCDGNQHRRSFDGAQLALSPPSLTEQPLEAVVVVGEEVPGYFAAPLPCHGPCQWQPANALATPASLFAAHLTRGWFTREKKH
jgi:hypothetical protein